MLESKILKDFRGKGKLRNEKMIQDNFLPLERFITFDKNTYTDGSISAKYKLLMGLVVCSLLRCNNCIIYHINKCIDTDSTKEEINELLSIALVIRGSIIILYLRYAYYIFDKFVFENNQNND